VRRLPPKPIDEGFVAARCELSRRARFGSGAARWGGEDTSHRAERLPAVAGVGLPGPKYVCQKWQTYFQRRSRSDGCRTAPNVSMFANSRTTSAHRQWAPIGANVPEAGVSNPRFARAPTRLPGSCSRAEGERGQQFARGRYLRFEVGEKLTTEMVTDSARDLLCRQLAIRLHNGFLRVCPTRFNVV
jgi:hypothetical protein